jgi:hypothetical protein
MPESSSSNQVRISPANLPICRMKTNI